MGNDLNRINDSDWISHTSLIEIQHVDCPTPGFYCHHELSEEPKKLSDPSRCTITEGCPERCSCYYDSVKYHVIVDCNQRQLRQIPKHVPDRNNSFLILDYSNNYIEEMPVVPYYWRVISLSLSGNNISTIPTQSLYHLTNLRHFYLSNSSISQLQKESLNAISELVGRNLSVLELVGEMWSCECDQYYFAIFITDHLKVFADVSQMLCYTPSSKHGMSVLKGLRNCPRTEQINVIAVLGSVVSLLLILLLVLTFYGYRFRIKYVWYSFQLKMRCGSRKKMADNQYVHDAYIAYSHQDVSWVQHNLLPELEETSPRFKLCIPDRDCPPGNPIAENIVREIEKSRKVIVLLAKDFLQDPWNNFEIQTAFAEGIRNRMDKIIIVLLTDIATFSPELLDENRIIRNYLRTRSYLHVKDALFWKRLRKYLGSKSVNSEEETNLQAKVEENVKEDKGLFYRIKNVLQRFVKRSKRDHLSEELVPLYYESNLPNTDSEQLDAGSASCDHCSQVPHMPDLQTSLQFETECLTHTESIQVPVCQNQDDVICTVPDYNYAVPDNSYAVPDKNYPVPDNNHPVLENSFPVHENSCPVPEHICHITGRLSTHEPHNHPTQVTSLGNENIAYSDSDIEQMISNVDDDAINNTRILQDILFGMDANQTETECVAKSQVQPSDITDCTNKMETSDITDSTNKKQTSDITDATNKKQTSDITDATNKKQTSDVTDATNKEQRSDVTDATNKEQTSDITDATNKEQRSDVTDATNKEQRSDITDATNKDQTFDVTDATSQEQKYDITDATNKEQRSDITDATNNDQKYDITDATNKDQTSDVTDATDKKQTTDVTDATSQEQQSDITDATNKEQTSDVTDDVSKKQHSDITENGIKERQSDFIDGQGKERTMNVIGVEGKKQLYHSTPESITIVSDIIKENEMQIRYPESGNASKQMSNVNINPKMIREELPDSITGWRYYHSAVFDFAGGHLMCTQTKVILSIPPGAIPIGEQVEIYFYVSFSRSNCPDIGEKECMISPVVICGPNGYRFQESVILTYPHCARNLDNWNINPLISSQTVGERHVYTQSGEDDGAIAHIGQDAVTWMLDHFTGATTVGTQTPDSDREITKQVRFITFASSLEPNAIDDIQIRAYLYHSLPGIRELIDEEESDIGGLVVNPPNSVLIQEDGGDVILSISGYQPNWNLYEKTSYESQKIHFKSIWSHIEPAHAAFILSPNNNEVKRLRISINVRQVAQDEIMLRSALSLPRTGKRQDGGPLAARRGSIRVRSVLPYEIMVKVCLCLDRERKYDDHWDFKGFAEALGLRDYDVMMTMLDQASDRSPTSRLLSLWEHSIIKTEKRGLSISHLQKLCEVFTDSRPDVAQILNDYLDELKKEHSMGIKLDQPLPVYTYPDSVVPCNDYFGQKGPLVELLNVTSTSLNENKMKNGFSKGMNSGILLEQNRG